MSLRSRLLNRSFRLLYGPLQFLHEPAGRCLFGQSWHGRRVATLSGVPPLGRLLDVGCGSGLLLALAAQRHSLAIGIDPSRAMLLRARDRGLLVVAGRSDALPFTSRSFDSIVATYPGGWILNDRTWQEFARVLEPGGAVAILLGGTVEHGRAGKLRSIVTGVLYGSQSMDVSTMQIEAPVRAGFAGSINALEDAWGTVYRWDGILLEVPKD